MSKKVLIIGGVAGGASAAARLRRLDENAEIILFERGNYISFANCGLPYYIGDVIKDRNKLLVQTAEGIKRRFNIDVRVNSEVVKILKETKEIEVKSDARTYKESYDYLILSPGAKPLVPDIPGIGNECIFTLRNMQDVDKIKSFITEKNPEKAAVIGGGYIGIEMAENLRNIGLDVTLVEAAPQILGIFDMEMARILEKQMVEKGIGIINNDAVEKFEDEKDIKVILKSGRVINCDLAILAIGVKPENKLAKDAGLTIGDKGGIKVDEYMRTSDPFIYAVGDAVEVDDFITGEKALIPLAGPANKQGRIAADNICGRNISYRSTIGTSILKIFGLTAAAAGKNERILRSMGIPYLKSYTHSSSHAGYYPGAFPMSIKLIFTPDDGKILGAQVIGKDGVDKRVDVLSVAIRHNLTVYDLEELELAYAPPYSSAKDPVNMAGFVASNILKGDMKAVYFDEVDNLDRNKNFILDVRTPLEFDAGHIKDAVNIPVDVLRGKISDVPKDKKIIVYCKVGLRGYIACRILMQNGFDAYNLSGGYDTYSAAKITGNGDIKANDEMTRFEVKDEDKFGNAVTVKIDACGLQCPGPIMKVYNKIGTVKEGDILEVHVTDPAFKNDIKSWCERTGNKLLGVDETCCDYTAYIKKGTKSNVEVPSVVNSDANQGKTIVVFSGDLDKAIASFIIANGAAAMGRKVTMFFTFWGLNLLRKDNPLNVKKTFVEKIFGIMMPRGSKKLGLSKMNMFGMGSRMIRGIMKKKNITSLEDLIENAKNNGVKLMACSMSMDVMGIKKEELIDGIEIGGVATYLGDAEQSNVNLFI